MPSGRLRHPVFLRWIPDGSEAQSRAGNTIADLAKPSAGPELVLLIGLPASGKSTFYRSRFAGTHTQVSKDLLRPRSRATRRQREMIELSLRRGAPVVVDNTNATVEERAQWLSLGRSYGARLVGYYFDSPRQECLARNRRRPPHQRVPDVAIHVTAAKFKEPSMIEGFDELRRVRLLPGGEFAEGPMQPTLSESKAHPDNLA